MKRALAADWGGWRPLKATHTATLPHTLSKVFAQGCSVWSVQDEGSEDKNEWKIQRSICYVVFPYLSHLLPISLPLSLFPPPHPTLSRVLQIALPIICLTSFFLSSFLPNFLSFNSVLMFFSLFSMHCPSLVSLLDSTLWIFPQLKSDICFYSCLGSIGSICLSPEHRTHFRQEYVAFCLTGKKRCWLLEKVWSSLWWIRVAWPNATER